MVRECSGTVPEARFVLDEWRLVSSDKLQSNSSSRAGPLVHEQLIAVADFLHAE
jgi:hypothetical protein